MDPTECGSLLAALRCTRPAPAVSKPCGGAVLSLDPCRGEADWRCRDCGADYSCQYVVDTVRGLDITAATYLTINIFTVGWPREPRRGGQQPG